MIVPPYILTDLCKPHTYLRTHWGSRWSRAKLLCTAEPPPLLPTHTCPIGNAWSYILTAALNVSPTHTCPIGNAWSSNKLGQAAYVQRSFPTRRESAQGVTQVRLYRWQWCETNVLRRVADPKTH
jgi:hypothetical protein